MSLLKRNSTINLRDHIGMELAALSLVAVASVAWAALQAGRTARRELDSRTRARLIAPPKRPQTNSEAS
jgi:hypothetical protein